MSSRAISGKPGGGKSYYATEELICEELMRTDRFIVTNIPLKPSNILDYLAENGREDISFDERILLVGNDNQRLNNARFGDEAMRDFWRYRGPEFILSEISDREIKEGVRPQMESFGKVGVHYFLDEWHEFCNSRQWAQTGPMLLWYVAKHRHFGDDVTWITQHVPNVDKQWRSVTQEYLYCRNFSKEKFWGFNKGSRFTVSTYLEPFTGTQQVQEVKSFTINPKIADCYYTSLANTKADTGQKVKGLNVKWLFGGIALAGLLLWAFFAFGFQALMGKVFGVKEPQKTEQRGNPPVNPLPSSSGILNTPNLSHPEPEKPWHVLSVPLKESTAQQAIESIKADGVNMPDVFISANGANNALILTGNDLQRLVTFAEVCRNYDAQTQLVTINCVVGRLVQGKGQKIGLYDFLQQSAEKTDGPLSDLLASAVYDFSTGIATFGSTIAARELLKIVTDFQSSDGRFEVVSRPTLTIVAGQKGLFSTGREIPIANTTVNNVAAQTSISFKEAEFSFEVRPTIRPDGWVRLDIVQSNSDVLTTADIKGEQAPVLSKQKLKTLIDLNPRQVAYLGGIHIRTSRKDRRGVPVLRDIPGINFVFGTRETVDEISELVILVSVDVHGRLETPVRVLKALPVSGPSWSVDTATISGVAASGTHNGQTQRPKNKKGKSKNENPSSSNQ